MDSVAQDVGGGASRAAARSAASSCRVEETKTRSRWSGVRIIEVGPGVTEGWHRDAAHASVKTRGSDRGGFHGHCHRCLQPPAAYRLLVVVDTPAATPAPSSEAGRSRELTLVLGVVVLVLGIVFALESSWYANWYALFRVAHVVMAVFWVGGGLTLTVLGLRAERMNDAREIATVARQAAFVGERFFAPAGLIVLLMGIAMMINTDLGWGKFWIVVGLVGYATTFVTGIAVLAPVAKKVAELAESQGPEAPETQAAIRRILLVARVDIAVLLLVVADMVTKPFS
jgi:uncharacterized membrane protein